METKEKEIEKIITIEDKEYLVRFQYICGLMSCVRKIKVRQKGEREWEDMKLLAKEEKKLCKLYWKDNNTTGCGGKEYRDYYMDCMRRCIPTLDKVLQELREELAEKLSKKLKEQILESGIVQIY